MYCPSCGAKNEDAAQFCAECGAKTTESAATGAPPTPPPPPSSGPTHTPSAGPTPSTPPPRPPAGGGIDIGGWISQGFNEAMSDFLNYFLLGLVVSIVSSVTIGILAGPLMAGGLIVIRRKLRGQGKIDIGAVFNEGFKFFLPTFLLVFITIIAAGIVIGVLQFLPVIGQLVGIVIAGFLAVFLAIGVHYITEEGQDFMPAAKSAWEAIQHDIVMMWLFGLIVCVISGIGAIACGIGAFFTSAAGLVMLCLMLENMFPKR